jgi:hypothetical protein
MCGSRYGVRGLLYALCAMPANLSPEYKIAEQALRARLWGSGAFDGQRVGREHRVADGDIVELHAR